MVWECWRGELKLNTAHRSRFDRSLMTWPNSNYGHYGRLETDGISDWHPAFLQLAPTLTGCAKRYQRFCQNYRSKSKPVKIRQWGNKLIALLKSTTPRAQGRGKRISQCIGQQALPLNLPILQH